LRKRGTPGGAKFWRKREKGRRTERGRQEEGGEIFWRAEGSKLQKRGRKGEEKEEEENRKRKERETKRGIVF
jgi:hypothetical protein